MNESASEPKRTARFCSYCGTKLDEGARFCKNCGESVGVSTEAPRQNKTGNPCDLWFKNKRISGSQSCNFSAFLLAALLLCFMTYCFNLFLNTEGKSLQNMYIYTLV